MERETANMRKWAFRLAWSAAMILSFSLASRAQEDTKPADQDQQQKDSSATSTGKGSDETPPPVAAVPDHPLDTRVHPAIRAVPWLGTEGTLRYGPFSLKSVEVLGVDDQFSPTDGGPNVGTQLSLIRTNIGFDQTIKKSHISLTYTPELVTYNGHTGATVDGNNGLSLGDTFELSPRLTVAMTDQLALTHANQIFPDQYLLIDRETGGLVQTYFLENTGSYFENMFTTSVVYKWSPRLLLTVTPDYMYADTHGPKILAANLYIVDDFDNYFNLTYALTPHRTIGAYGSVDVVHPVRPKTFNTGLFRTVGAAYSEQLSPSFWINGTIGAEVARYPGFNANNWGVEGGFALVKTFGTSDLALDYHRASTVANFIANHQIENADLSYGQTVFRPLKCTAGIGYFREIGANPRVIGKYAIFTAKYHLVGGFSLISSYSWRSQRSSTPELISGNRNTFFGGLQWNPGEAHLKK